MRCSSSVLLASIAAMRVFMSSTSACVLLIRPQSSATIPWSSSAKESQNNGVASPAAARHKITMADTFMVVRF